MPRKVKADPKKIKEAEDYLKNAQKCVSKSMFKWQPDYLNAAPNYQKAGESFRAGGDLHRARMAYEKAAEANHHHGGSFKAAQQLEIAAGLAIEEAKRDGPSASSSEGAAKLAKGYYEQAAGMYCERGELSKASDTLRKGASVMEKVKNVEVAMELYLEACNLMETLEKPHYALECFRLTLRFLVQNKQFTALIPFIDRMIAQFRALNREIEIHRLYLTTVIVHLVCGDIVAADRAFTQHLQEDAYLHSDECKLAEDLLMAFKNGNEEALGVAIKNQGFHYLENAVVRLVKKMTLYGGQEVQEPREKPKRLNRPTKTESTMKMCQQLVPKSKEIASKGKASTIDDMDAALDAFDLSEDDEVEIKASSAARKHQSAMKQQDQPQGNKQFPSISNESPSQGIEDDDVGDYEEQSDYEEEGDSEEDEFDLR